jgi:gliding motility-associated-like protein
VYNDGNGCTTTDNVTLNVIPVVELYWPNAFSPNGDGNNDFYMPYGSNVKLIEWKIFNRWGEKVFQSTSFFQGWDGTYKGEMQNPQLFVYEANVTMMNNSNKKFKGSFMLIR